MARRHHTTNITLIRLGTACMGLLALSCSVPQRHGAAPAEPSEPVALAAHTDPPTSDARARLAELREADPIKQLELLTAGATALSNGDPGSAEVLLGQYLELDPGNGMALFLRGVSLLDLGRPLEARDCLEASTVADPDDASGYAVLARIEFEMGNLDEAAAALEEATRCAPGEAQHWTSLGLIYFEQDRWNQAYEALLQAVELDPDEAAAHRALGRLYVAVGEYEMAERAFRTALALDPQDTALHVALGHVLRDLDRTEDGLEIYRAAAELEPDNPWLQANIASTLMELQRPREARPHFEAALSTLEGSGPDHAFISLNYGGMLEKLGDHDGAEAAYESAVEAAPDLAQAHEALGMLRLDLGDRERAYVDLARAFNLGHVEPDTLLELALLFEQDEDWGAAFACAQRLLDLEGLGPQMDYRRARLLMRSRHPEVHDVSAAVQLLRPLVEGKLRNHPPSWELLSEALAELGDLEQAIGALDGALEASRPESPVHEHFTRKRARLVGRLEESRDPQMREP